MQPCGASGCTLALTSKGKCVTRVQTGFMLRRIARAHVLCAANEVVVIDLESLARICLI